MKKLLTAVCAVLAVSVMAEPADAQVQFGAQANYADDFDFGVGARAQFGIGSLFGEGALENLTGSVSADIFFPGFCVVDCTYLEFNFNGLYPIEIEDSDLAPYVGAGLHIGRFSVESGGVTSSNTEAGLNALGGLNFDLGGLAAFAEAKIELGGYEQLVLAFGILFGSAD